MFFPVRSYNAKVIAEVRAAALAAIGNPVLETEIEVRDMTLCNGTVLPNRKLRREFYRLLDGSKVTVRDVIRQVNYKNTIIGIEVVGA